MSIGDFSRATRLTAKSLRFYHQAGLLSPARIDESSGYRFYAADQIPEAQLIRSFRSMEMPITVIREVLSASNTSDRDRLIAGHLTRMEMQLESTRAAVASLRSLLEQGAQAIQVERRSVQSTCAVIIRETIELADLSSWYNGAKDELDALVKSGDVSPSGPRGGIWDTELFLNERGEAALFFPVFSAHVTPGGRSTVEILPAVDLAVASHSGADDTIAKVYGALGSYVTAHELSVDGPIRESYLVEASSAHRQAVTEIGWPIIPLSQR